MARGLVVIGASAGGVETLKQVVGRLPTDLPAAICVVLHVAPDSPSALAAILRRAGALPCRSAKDGDVLVAGEILVAPPDRHLIVEDSRVRLTVGPRENNHRPAVDALFRSAAAERGPDVVGVVLSGTMDDGTAGLAVIKSHGGLAIVQDPADALYPGMPASAVANVAVDAVVPSARVAETITAMVNAMNSPDRPDPAPTSGDPDPDSGTRNTSIMICPECGGVLSEHTEAGAVQWSCRVGHRYSPETLIDTQAGDVEAALWTAVRALEDRALLLLRLGDQSERRHQMRSARSFRRRADAARRQAHVVRQALAGAANTSLSRTGDDEESALGEEDVA
jgi:two-component system, chemotaxis family, protein-glutamate methylesterase/glutaminase